MGCGKAWVLLVVLVFFFVLTGTSLAKGPHTDTTIYNETEKSLTGVCSACHVAHGAKDTRLWPVTVEDTSGVSSIQNLCMTCHKRNDEDADGKGGFFVGDHDAHILSRAHGQNGPSYDGTAKKRWGPGHLYRSNCTTRYEEPVIGYGTTSGLGYPSFESIACYADPYETGKDNLMLPRLSCTSCHDPHAEYIVGSYTNRRGALQTYESPLANNYILDVVGDSALFTTYYTAGVLGRTRDVCVACHGSSNNSSKIKIDGLTPLQPTLGIRAHDTSSVSSKCTDCHSWDWLPANCTACHGNPPSAVDDGHNYASTLAFPAFTSVGVGAHDTHVKLEGYNSCEVCHYGYTHYNGTVDVRFNTTGITFPRETKIRSTDTCIVTGSGESKKIKCIVGCHEPKVGSIDDSTKVPWPTIAVSKETVYTLVSCISCHDAVGKIFTSTVPNASSHPYATDTVVSERQSCEICHRDHKWAEYDSFSKKWKGNDDPYGIYPGDTVRHRLHASMFGGFTSTFEWNPLVFNSTDAPDVNNPSVRSPCSGFCNPCHDVTPFKITYESGMVHDTSCAPFESVDYCYSAPMAARFFYESTIAGSGGHGQSSTQVSDHKMELECRDCHRYHGSSIAKILCETAARPSDAYTRGGESSEEEATGNDNTFCYRCHFFPYDNGFYSKTAYESSIHGDTSSSSNFKIWSDNCPVKFYAPYAPSNGHSESYFWKPDEATDEYKTGLCIYCHEPHGGYGWDVNVFDTPGFSSFTRAGTRGSYIDSSKYGTAVNLGDENLCFKCHTLNSSYNVYSETTWSNVSYADDVYNMSVWGATGLDISSYFNTTRGSRHHVHKDEQKKDGPLGNTNDYLIIECINCHNPHTVRKNVSYDSVVESLMYPFRPAEIMSDTAVTGEALEYKVYNKFCLSCHNEKSESSGVYDGSNEQRGMIYKTDSTRGKLPRGIKFSNKTKWGEGGTAFHSWNKAAYYNSTGHGMDSTLSIGYDSEDDRLPLARYDQVGLSCGRVGNPMIHEFACHDPHGNTTNVSLLRDDLDYPNYYPPHVYDSTPDTADQAKNTDRWCAAICHHIGGRQRGLPNWLHAFTYARRSEAPYDSGVYSTTFGVSTVKDVDIYDVVGDGEPILDNSADKDQDTACVWTHSSYNRVPGDGNNWPDESGWGYDTNYKLYLPAKSDTVSLSSRRFVCFTCHDPHGTKYRGMVRYDGEGELCLKCHIPQ